MRSPSVQPKGTTSTWEGTLRHLIVFDGIERQRASRRVSRFCWMLAFLALFPGCVHIPISSETVIRDELQTIPFVEPGEVLLVFGENAALPPSRPIMGYITFGCGPDFHRRTLGNLIKAILKANPQPGRFAVRHAETLDEEEGAVPTRIEGGRLKLSRDRVLKGRLRYAVHVKEAVSYSVHVPLYLPPLGVASCGHQAVLEAELWDLTTERSLGSLTVTAEAEFTVVAYGLHLAVSGDTQADAAERLGRIIIEKLTGMKPLEAD